MKSEKVKEKEKGKKKIQIFDIMVAICIILFSIAIAPKSLQNDTFYTVKVGEYIAQNGIFNLTEDTFSWHELPYTYPHWLYDLGIYLIYNLSGQTGIYISTMIFTAILGWTIYLSSSKRSGNKVVSFVLTILSVYFLREYIAARAQLVTFILFSLTVYFIEMFLSTHKKRYAVYLLIIPILITNLHCAVFPFYFVLFLPYIVEYLWITILDLDLDYKIINILLKIVKLYVPSKKVKDNCQKKIDNIPAVIEQKREKRNKRRKNPYKIKVAKEPYVKWLIVIVIIAAFTGFLNPTGTGAYTYTYKIYQGNTTDSINEHLPVTLIDSKEYLCVLCVFLAILVFTDTKIRLSDLFMFAGLTILSLMSRRQISMFLIFCTPILARLISDMVQKYDEKTFKDVYNFMSTTLISTTVVLIFSIGLFGELSKKKTVNYIDESTYPTEMATWMLDNLDVQNIKIYNEYNYGSYLLFRGIPVFIDSRCDLYSPEFNDGDDIFSDALNIAGISVDYEKKFNDYGVTHVIVYSNSKLAMLLREDDKYNNIKEDEHFVLFERIDTNEIEE